MHALTLTPTPTRRRDDLLAGVRAMAPLMLAYLPFALVIGSAVAQVDDPVAGWAGSWLIYAGSAHLAVLKGVHDGAISMAIATGLLINLRLLLYGASIAPQWRGQPTWFRLVGAALLIDPTWALADRFSSGGATLAAQRRFFIGAALTLGIAWSSLIAVGAVIGDRLPDVGLELAAPVCLIALIGTRVKTREHRWAAVTAAVVGLLTFDMPSGIGTIVAITAGCVAAQFAGRWAR